MSIIELSKVLPGYSDVDWSLLRPMIYEHDIMFDMYKMEKDFLLTVLLIYIGERHPELIFKGGTCLNKIYYEYYRLSEDLDFVVVADIGRGQRSKLFKSYNDVFSSSVCISLGLKLGSEQTQHNQSTQGCFTLYYLSAIDNSEQTIKIDIRIEPKLLLPPVQKPIKAIFTDPIYGSKFFHEHMIHVMDLDEMMAEKTRAALTRDPSAIRDFFDIWYAKEKQSFDFARIQSLINEKVANLPYVIDDNYVTLQGQIVGELDPVLTKEYRGTFDLDPIYQFLLTLKKTNA